MMSNHHALEKLKDEDDFKGMKKILQADWEAMQEMEGVCHLLSIYAKNESHQSNANSSSLKPY